MLTHLTITNLALVERIELALGPGLNVLTGETGAGKSVLIGAISLLLGGRGSAQWVREGADEALVEGLFEFARADDDCLAERLTHLGLCGAADELLVRRSIRRSGRGRITVNGQMVTVSMLQELMRGFVDLTSQHEHVGLLDADAHLDLLDRFGGLGTKKDGVREAYRVVELRRAALQELDDHAQQRARREDYLRFALEEIESVAPEEGERQALSTERVRLKNVGELVRGLAEAEALISLGEPSVLDLLGRAQGRLDHLADLDEGLAETRDRLAGLIAEGEEVARDLERHRRGIEPAPERLAEVEERLSVLDRLARKYGGTVEEVLAAASEMSRELEAMDDASHRRAGLEDALREAQDVLSGLAAELSRARREASCRFERSVQAALADLAMANTRVEVQLRPMPRVTGRGAEAAAITFAPNHGESVRPLAEVASGGELSRFLLAVKRVLAATSDVAVHVFDEVDTGIGGAVAEAVGVQLASVGRSAQVLAVTHLPQVAAFAQTHFRVFKGNSDERTVTGIERLDEERAIEELARMLGGAKITSRTRALARELRCRAALAKPIQGLRDRQGKGSRRSSRRTARVEAVAITG